MNNKSFTLIEILVAMLVVGILSSIIYVATGGARERADFARVLMFSTKLNNSLADNVAGQWDLNEGTGSSASDSSGNNNTGTITGATWQTVKTSCVSGYCLNFDGSDDFVDCVAGSSLVNITGAITIDFWFNTNTLTLPNNHRMIFEGNAAGNSYISLYGNNLACPFLSLSIGGTQRTLNSNLVPLINTWYHVVGTWDTDKMRIYVNGVLKGTSISYTGVLNMAGAKYIGKYVAAGYNFSGKIDEVRVYDKAASISQIKQNYYSGLNNLLSMGTINYLEYKEKLAELKYNINELR